MTYELFQYIAVGIPLKGCYRLIIHDFGDFVSRLIGRLIIGISELITSCI
jgi:hypothetical protein